VTENGYGIFTGTGGTAYATATAITGNEVGVHHPSGTVVSFGDNRLANNGTNGTFSSTLVKQ
jgi:hypothetical protein